MFYSSCCSFTSNFLFYLPLILFFIFIFPPTHRPCIDLHRPHFDTTSTSAKCFPPSPPHFYCLPSTTTTTFLLFSFHHFHPISIFSSSSSSSFLMFSTKQVIWVCLFDLSLAFFACISPFWPVFGPLPWAWPVWSSKITCLVEKQ